MFYTMETDHNRLLKAAFSSAAVLPATGVVVAWSLRFCLERASHLGAEKLSCGGFALRMAGCSPSVFPKRFVKQKAADPAERVVIPSLS